MSRNFKPRLLLLTRTTIKNILGIDVVHTANNVVVIQKGILIGGGYNKYTSAIYEIHGVSNGKPYSIRLFTTYEDGYSLTGFQLDRDTDGITTRWGANLTLSESDMSEFDIEERFPSVGNELITREDLCQASKETSQRIYDEDLINVCDPANTAPTITMNGSPMVTVTETDPFTDPGATAYDAIDGDLTADIIVGGDNIDTNVTGNYVITYTVTDAHGATAMAVRHVHVVPNQPPVITLNGDATMSVIEGNPFVDPGVIVDDTEDGNISASVVVSGDTVDVNVPGSYNITYTVTDSHGASSSVNRTLEVIANDAPVLTLLGDNPMTLVQGEAFVEPGFNASDTEDGNLATSVTITGNVDTSTVGVYTLLYSVTDSGGKDATATRTVNIIQNTNPVITLNGDSTIEVLNGGTFVDPGFSAADVNDGDLTGSVVVGGDTVDTSVDGVYIITYHVEDTNGGSTTVSRTVTVRTNEAPVITLNGDAVITLIEGEPYVEPGATATDSFDGDLTAGISITGNVDTSTAGDYTITYTVVDSDGVSVSESRLVHVLVNTAPTITLTGPNAVEVFRNEPYYEPGYSASDAEDGDLTSSVVLTPQPVETNLLGDVVRHYHVEDTNGGTADASRLIHVIEDVAPVITLNGDNPMQIYQHTGYVEPGATALDYRDGDVSANIIIGGDAVDANVPALYNVSYSVTDSHGNTSVKTRAVTVQANNAPVVTLNGSSTQTVIESQPYTELGATATDSEDGDVSTSITITGTVNTTVLGDYTIVYKAVDAHGVEGMATRVVSVVADQPPVITLVGDNPLTVVGGTPYVDPGYTATDDVDGDLTSSVVVGGDTVNTALSGTYNVTYSVTAANSAQTIVSRAVNVRFAPTITLTGGDMSLATGTPWVEPGYSAFDAEDGDLTNAVTVGGDTVVSNTHGVYNITYNVTDSDGMTGHAERTVTISDAPVLTLIGPSNVVVKAGDTYTDQGASAFDAEDGNLNASIVTVNPVDVNTPGTYTITYNVTDSNGIPADEVTRTVTVSSQPVITLVGDNPIVVERGTTYTDPGYSASDAEDGDLTGSVVVNSNVDTSTAGSYSVTYNVTDSNGISATEVVRTVKVSTRPVITLLGDNPLPLAYATPYTEPGYSASDAEDGDITSSVVVGGDTVNPTSVGTYNITYSVSDADGLTGVESRLVGVSHPPVVSLVGNSNVTVALNDTYTELGATATDMEEGDVSSSIVVSGDTVDTSVAGVYTITYTATDTVGLSNSVDRVVTVSEMPTVTLNGAAVIVVEKGTAFTDPGATATDSAGTDISSSIVVAGSVDTNTAGSYSLIYTVTDANGLSGNKTRVVNVSAKPVITLLGDNPLTVELSSTYTDAGATATDAEDGDLTASIVTTNTVDTSTSGDYTVTYTVQDSNFLSDTKVRNVTVSAKPVITLAGGNTITVVQNSTYTDPGYSASDAEDGDITANVVVSGDTVDTATLGAYTVSYTVTDSNGLTDTKTRIVNVKAKPVITLLGDANTSVALTAAYTDPGATASDVEDGDITANIVTVNPVDTSVAGTYTITYNVTDSNGFSADEVTRTVNVSTKPSITLLGNNPMTVEKGTAYAEPGYTATDPEDGDITANVVVSGDTVDGNVAGTYTVNYDVSDSSGLAADTVTRTVNVSTKPSITLNGDSAMTIAMGSVYTDAGASASDAEDGDLTASIVTVNGVSTAVAGVYTVTYDVSDSSGLAADTVTRTVTVNANPTITLNGANPLVITQGGTYTDPGAIANDPEDGDISANIVVGGDTVDVNTPGTYNVTYTVTDSGGATTTETRVVTISAINAVPTITLTGGSTVYHEHNSGTWTDPGYSANDTEDGDITASVVISGDTVDDTTNATYTVTYTVTDSAGATATVDRTVIVTDPPTLTLLPDAAGNTGDVWGDLETHPYVDPGYTATGYDGNAIVANIPTQADPNTIGTYQVWTHATDPITGFVTSKKRTVQIHQSIAPTLTILGDNPITLITNDTYTDAGATAVDITTIGNDTPSIITTNDLDVTANGSYTYTYTFTGAYGDVLTKTRNITVTSANQAPVITVTGDNPAYVAVGTSYTDAGATATDTEDGDISSNVAVSGSVNTNVKGTYTLTYTVTDSYGVSSTATRDVNVVSAPYIITDEDDAGAENPIWVETNGTRTDTTSAMDYNDNDITASMVTTNPADLTTVGDYTETYTVTDPVTGLTATETRVVKVMDYIGSVMTLNGDATMLVPLGGPWNDPAVTLIDRVMGDVSGDEDAEAGDIVDVNTAGTYNVVYEYAGSYDNNVPVSVSRTVKVSTPPVISLTGNATESVALNGTYTDAGATATDAEDGDITANIVTVNPVDTSVAGTYTVTYNVTDSVGFSADEVTRVVTVTPE